MRLASRRGSWQIVQGVTVSRLPQLPHSTILAAASLSAAAKGSSSSARRLSRAKAALRAERDPRPGNRANRPTNRSISLPDDFLLIVRVRARPTPRLYPGRRLEKLQSGRQRQAPGDLLHLGLHRGLDLALGVLQGGHD